MSTLINSFKVPKMLVSGGTADLYEDRLVLSKKSGQKTILLSQLMEVIIKKAGMDPPAIRFVEAGNQMPKHAKNDANSIEITNLNLREADAFKNNVEQQMRKCKSNADSRVPIAVAASASAADELLKMKALLDAGAITPIEFAAIKSKLGFSSTGVSAMKHCLFCETDYATSSSACPSCGATEYK